VTPAATGLTRALEIPGWMELDELRWLADQARTAALVVEVGAWKGRSTRALADHCPGVVYAVDSWSGPTLTDAGAVHPLLTEVYQEFVAHLGDRMALGRVIAVREPSQVALPRLRMELGAVADLVFLDGDHRYVAVAADIAAALTLLRPGGLLCGHDFTNAAWPGVARAVRERFGETYHRAGKSIWWVRP
jgi:predicted O-methyltransferase YrrM